MVHRFPLVLWTWNRRILVITKAEKRVGENTNPCSFSNSQWSFGYAGLFIEKQIDIMELIPYEQFTINPSSLERLTEHYVRDEIKKYFKENGTLPSKEIVDTFTLPADKLEKYKKHYYAEYYRKELEFEEKYGPRELIEVSFDFSATEDNDSALLGTRSTLALGTIISGDNIEYQYEYWVIVIEGGGISKIGSFTSLKNASIKLYSLSKYRIWVYHRKSNYEYSRIIPDSNIDENFHDYWWQWMYGHEMSMYSSYTMHNEDKEYIGFIDDYVPTQSGLVKGNVYTLNPRIALNVSGLTDDVVFELNAYSGLDGYYGKNNNPVRVLKYSGGTIIHNETISEFTKSSDSSISCILEKNIVIPSLMIFHGLNGAPTFDDTDNRIEDKNSTFVNYWYLRCLVDNEVKETVRDIGHIPRNDILTVNVVIPPLGTNIDTGFDFITVDD